MEIDLDLSVGVRGGAAALDDDEEVGEFSDEELCDLPERNDEEEPSVIDNVNDAIVHFAALEDRPAKKQAQASLMQLWKK